MSRPTRPAPAPGRRLRHPAELPFFVFMAVPNVIIVVVAEWFAGLHPVTMRRLERLYHLGVPRPGVQSVESRT